MNTNNDNKKISNHSESKNEYMNTNNENKKISNNNELKKYIHDIRNSKSFSIDILKNINNLSYEDRLEILIVYNKMINYYLTLFEDNE
jgi:hypothetical protein